MAKQYGSQRKRSGAPFPVVAIGIMLLGLVGGALILQALGVVTIPLLSKRPAASKPPDHTGKTRVYYAGRTIQAYAKVTSNDLVDPKTGQLAVYWFPTSEAEGMIGDLTEITGRVLRHEKPQGYVFTQKDFYPEGTRPGPTAGVPVGKRAMRLKADDVPGLHGLEQGDHFDIVMTQVVEVEENAPRTRTPSGDGLDVVGPYAKLHERESMPEQRSRVRVKRKHAEVKTIVNDGIVVQPVTKRNEIGQATSLVRGTSLTVTPVEEIIIAVDPEEVTEVNMALALDAQLQVAMRSGQPAKDGCEDGSCIPDYKVVFEEEEETLENGTKRVGSTKIVESIKGGEKKLQAVPLKSANASE